VAENGVRAEVQARLVASEMRNEQAGSFIGLAGLSATTLYIYLSFRGLADAFWLHAWAIFMAAVLGQWLLGLVNMTRRRPSDAEMLRFWIPAARTTMTLSNIATAASVWILLPAAPDALRLVMITIYLSYVVVQLSIATEATQVATSAVVMVLGSVIAFVATSGEAYAAPLALFLAMIGAMLLAVRRLIRRNVVAATEARLLTERTAERLRAALEVVAAERDARTRFIRAASHDLSQPLQAARLFFEDMQRARDAGARDRAATGVRRAFASTASLLDGMLMHLRLEAGVVRSVPETIDLDDFSAQLAFDYGPLAAEAGMRLRTPRGRLFVDADPQLLKRVVGNLIANGIRHSRGENVLVAARRAGPGRIRLWVLDDGEGVEPAVVPRLFEDFAQGPKSERSGGFGIGLASAKKLAEAMGGSVGHDPRWRSGGAFFVDLPAARAMAPSRVAA
jgi:signal transduction histidine kinase